MRILFILENYFPHIGGVESVFKNLCEDLASLGNDVSVVTHRLKDTKKFEIVNNVSIYRVNCFYSRYWFTFFSIPLVIKLARKSDFIHTTMYNATFPAKIASILLKKKVIITVPEILGKNWEEFGMGSINGKIHKLLEQLIIRFNFDRYISISKSTEKNVLAEGVPKEKSIVVYCGIDYKIFNPNKYNALIIRKKLRLEKKFVYMFYGRPGISKGLEYLIQAVPLISKEIPNSRLLAIVSKDKAYEKRYSYILRLINTLGIQDKIVLIDPVKYQELPLYIKSVDCVVVPSLTEGFGFCAVEACAMRKPVVASNTTSLPEVVSGKYVLVKPRDPRAIAKGVCVIYRGKTVTTKLKQFKSSDTTKNYLNVYRSAIKY